MKKQRHHLLKTLVTMLLVVTMVLSTAVTAMAAPGGRWGRGWNWGSWGSSAAETAEEEEPAVESEPEAAVEEAAEEPAAEEEAAAEEAEAEEPAAEEEAEEPAAAEEVIEAEEAEEPAAEEEAEEEIPEITYPAQDLEEAEGDLTVKVEAPEGALPEGAKLQIEKVDADDYQSDIEDVAGEGVKIALAVDITFLTADGEPIEPNGDVKVTMSAPEIEEIENPEIVHIPDEGSVEKIGQADEDSADDEVVFESGEFSVYAVVEGDDTKTHQITYHFLDGQGNPYLFLNTAGETVSEQIIKNGEFLQAVPAPGLLNGQAFNGWYIWENNSYGAEVTFGEAITVNETKDVYIKAHYGSVIYVTFYQYAAGKVVLERKQLAVNESTGKASMDMSSVTVPAPKTTLKFMGWSLTEGTDASEQDGDAIGSRPLLSNGVVEFTEDTEVYPVYYAGIWIVFVSADTGMGATYVPSYFITGDSTSASAAKPTDPTMTGYAFDGWFTEPEAKEDYISAESSGSFNFNTSFADLSNYTNDRGEVVLYGHWKGGNTTYVVVYWKQQVGNSKDADDSAKTYDYAGQDDPITATTGSAPTPTTAQQRADNGFEYKRYKLTDGEGNDISGIAADGSSILNVYFDRKLITMNFGSLGYYSSYTITNTFTGLYGQTLAQNGYAWPNSYGWLYRSNGGTSGGTQYAMSYLGQFVLPTNRINGANSTVTTVNFYRADGNTKTIYYYVQNADGTWPTTPIDSGETTAGSIQIAQKFDGFTMDAYQYNNGGRGGNYSPTTWTSVQPNESEKDVRDNMAIRYRRLPYEIKYLNPLNENQVLASKTLLYGASLASAAPASGTEIDLGVPGYEWDGNWYKDKNCTVPFNFNSEVMPMDGTKVYAGKSPLHYYIKIDPNGGELQTNQATWRWVTYGDDTTYTYDNITRDYIEYKGSGTAYYYYYDEFDISRRDEIWNYEYMASNPRTARYITSASDIPSGGGSAWLGTEKFSYEGDAYSLIGWYDITDGTANMKPFKTGTAITRDTIIQAQWRRTGEYGVVYHVEAVDESGNDLMDEKTGLRVKGYNNPVDGAKYADKSDSAILDKLGVPAGYNFVGWYYDGKIYQPGDVFQILARLSDDNKMVHIYPVMEPVETLPVKVIDITFDANGGTFTDAADNEIEAIIADATADETGSYAPEFVKNDDGTYSIEKLKINESFNLLSAEAVERGITIDGAVVPGRGYRLKEWNTKADGTGTSFTLDTKVGVDEKDPIPNEVFAIWEEVFYVYHSATKKFETIVKGDSTDRWALTTGYKADGAENEKYTSNYYGGFSVYANGTTAAAGLTFKGGDVEESCTIAASYWTRAKAAKSADLWNANDTGAVYFLKEVPTSYLAKPVSITIRDQKGEGDVTSLHFLSVTDTNIYRAGGIKLNDTDKKGTFSKNLKLEQYLGETTTITAQSQFGLEGYLTVVNGGTQEGNYPACQAYWTTYDYVTVYGIKANIKDITI